jgi:hypothetical protein
MRLPRPLPLAGLVVVLALGSLAACVRRGPPPTPATILTRAEVLTALRPGARFITYRGDGTARGDTLARIASSGATELEGGSFELGDRLYRYAIWNGFPADSVTPGHLLEVVHHTRELAAWVRVLDAAHGRGARATHVSEGRARLGRRIEAQAEASATTTSRRP